MTDKRVLIIGAGVAGLSAALDLARLDVNVAVVEKSSFLGGHGIQLSCKATGACAKCGACVVEEQLRSALAHPRIRLMPSTEVYDTAGKGLFRLRHEASPIDPAKCTDCGKCYEACPEGAVEKGFSASHHPFFAILPQRCRKADPDCIACQDACPERAISLDREETFEDETADAVIAAVGFHPFDPADKPYGYGQFPDVVTTLDLERILRRKGQPARPSDGTLPKKIAFIQCVGSRDAKRNHLWCSKICCPAALRTARLIRYRHPETEVTVFYIDIQTFGKDFERFYEDCRKEIRFVRAIPADIFETDGRALRVIYADDHSHESREEDFDMVVLSIGLTPCTEAAETLRALGAAPTDTGFFSKNGDFPQLFLAGSAKGPMSIVESMADAGRTAWEVARFLKVHAPDTAPDKD